MNNHKEKKNLLYIFIGTIIEHLDSMLFALYLPIVAAYFFDAKSQDTKWFLGFLSFSLYFIVRPLGALILGFIGDKYGRKTALLISISVMSIATLGMGLVPSYAQIGAYATILFLFLRILQGLSVGGEYSTAMTYVFETANANNHLFYGALLIAATHVGGTIASICAYTSPAYFQHIFIIAGLIGLVSLKGRSLLTETYVNKKSERRDLSEYINNSALYSYLNVGTASACLIFIFYTTMIYFNKIITQKFGVDMQVAFLINLLLHLIWVIFTPITGIIGDRFCIAYRKIMRIGALGTIFIGTPALIIAYNSESLQLFVIAQLLITLSHIVFCMPTPKMICSFFTINTRNMHVSLSYGIGISLTAALIPTMNDFAYNNFGIYGTALLIVVFAMLGLASTVIRRSNG